MKRETLAIVTVICAISAGPPPVAAAAWASPNHFRLSLTIDARGRPRSNFPMSVELDFQKLLAAQNVREAFDEHTVEVIPLDDAGRKKPERVPHRIDRLFGSSATTLHFVMRDGRHTNHVIYFDTVESGRGKPRRYHGLVGDGDRFVEESGRREIAASHFDCFVDFDGDGDLDLFKGGVEPFVYCWENVGRNRLVERGRLASGGQALKLPCSRSNRSWLTVEFFDIDGDGDQDFFPSFGDGPDNGQIVFYRNVTREHGGQLTFSRVGPLQTTTGVPLAGGAQAGGWFPSIAFARDWDGDGSGPDALVGSNHRCWLYRCLLPRPLGGGEGRGEGATVKADQTIPQFADAIALQAAGRDIELVNPRFDCADIDGDGDLDLFAGTQPGPVHFFRNTGSRSKPELAAGVAVAWGGKYLIGDAHSGVKVADFDGDGLLDLVCGRFWERTDLNMPAAAHDFGGFWKNTGTRAGPRFERRARGAPFTGQFLTCDAVRQNGVRAVDWNNDGPLDLLAGDTDGFIWCFGNKGDQAFPVFAPGERLQTNGGPLCVAATGGHARFDVADWNNDGRKDLVVADGGGTVTLFLNRGRPSRPTLDGGEKLSAAGKPIQLGGRASVLVCDWNNDGRKDLVLADDKGFYFAENAGTDIVPSLAEPKPILFGGKRVSYVRPNLGSFVDWDGDGKRDFIAGHFENSIRLYRNIGSGARGSEPEFADADGVVIIQGESPQMVSGVDAVDWNSDGTVDVLTGQGHGGSGLRFYARNWIEVGLGQTRPLVTVGKLETTMKLLVLALTTCAFAATSVPAAPTNLLEVVRRYADTMIEKGRDTYGPQKSGLLLSALDRATLAPLKVRPAPPGGIRRGDRSGRPWVEMNGANPMLDQNLLRVFYALSEITGDARHAKVADEELTWFFNNTMSPKTSLLPWGEHLSWDVILDVPISGGEEMMHEYARPWVLWDRCFTLAPEASRRFALGVWEHQIANHQTGGYDRHAPYFEHGPVDGKDFPRHGAFYIGTWCYAWRYTKDETFLRAIEAILSRFERKRVQKDGTLAGTLGPLDLEIAATMVPDPLAQRLREFAAKEDGLTIAEVQKQLTGGTNVYKPPRWQNGYSAGTLASSAMFYLGRYEQTNHPAYRDMLIRIADLYLDSRPDEDVDAWPQSFAHVISAEVAAYRLTKKPVYLDEAQKLARLAVETFWQDSPLPRASKQAGHYEAITGGDSLALALLQVHAASHGLTNHIPSNTIDR